MRIPRTRHIVKFYYVPLHFISTNRLTITFITKSCMTKYLFLHTSSVAIPRSKTVINYIHVPHSNN